MTKGWLNSAGISELARKLVRFILSVTGYGRHFVYTAMVNYPTEANFMMPLPAYPVEKMCKIIDGFSPGATKLSRAFAAASLYYNYSQTEKCFKLEDETDAHGLHGWELAGMYRDGYANEDCVKQYGVMPRPHWITTEFGGTRIEQVLKRFGGNIIFSNGLQDPWSRGSVLKNISSSIVALVTEKGAHHADLRSATSKDPDWLVNQRKQEVEIIQKWISEYNLDMKQG
ncbi:alpha/beta-hydrolase superfamily protein [Forsythia ovata]|uniref:Alpha/beta-hydrolase superfamily protein n=1 Tax=Forsythia ovata TaxID=205694 RepID=A0ABD1SRT7_9LAMI